MADLGCSGNPEVNSDVISYVTISGKMLLICGFYISVALRSEVLALAFEFVFTSFCLYLPVNLSVCFLVACVLVCLCAYASLCIVHVCQCMPASRPVHCQINMSFLPTTPQNLINLLASLGLPPLLASDLGPHQYPVCSVYATIIFL